MLLKSAERYAAVSVCPCQSFGFRRSDSSGSCPPAAPAAGPSSWAKCGHGVCGKYCRHDACDQRPATSGCHALPSRSGWLSVSPSPANPGWAWTRGRIPVSAHGPLGYATVTIADLSGCLAVLARYRRIRTHALAWSLLRTPTGMVLQGQDCMRLARPGALSWTP